jgi:ELWxxDGT repeat protein
MKTSFWRRWCNSHRSGKPTGRVSRAGPRRQPLCLEALEDRVTPSLTPQMVLDINPGTASSGPYEMVAIGSTTYFAAEDGIHGLELWKNAGTAAGTVLVKDIYPGLSGSGIEELTNVNGTLFFTAVDATHGRELWKSDGTEAGTILVKDIRPGSSSAYPGLFTNVNGTLFFSARDGRNGYELWKSDGTAAGTVLVKDINPGGASSYATNLTNVNGTLFFTADDGTHGWGLWKSDGSAAGTVLVKDIPYFYSDTFNLTNVNGTLFFSALVDGTNGWALWKSDGSAAGTVLVKDFYPLSPNSWSPLLGNLTNVNGTLFFSADDGTHGWELWKSDGTAAGTTLVKDIYPGSSWYYDYYTGWEFRGNSSNPSNLTNVDGTLFFMAYDGTDWGMWKSDGTIAGTVLATDIGGDLLTNVNGTLFFAASDGAHGVELWKSDGTAAGTTLVKDINPGSSAYPGLLTNVNGTLFFWADDGVHGQELWVLVDDSQTQVTSLDVSGFPATIKAGAVGSFAVTAKNADGTTNTSYRGTVHFTSGDPQAVLPSDYTFTEADQGVHTFSATLRTAGSQSITTRDTVAPAGAGTQADITVNPAAASTMIVADFPSPITAGVAGSFTITLKDRYGNIAGGYTGTVHFTSSDAKAVLPGNYTFTAADAGIHTFSATLKTAGYQSLTVTDTANGALTGTQGSILVNPAAASRLLLSAPASVIADARFSLTVTLVDTYGNVVTVYRGTIAFRTSDSTAKLPRNYTFKATDQGVHTFTGLVLTKKGKQTITVTDTLDSSLAASVSIDVL